MTNAIFTKYKILKGDKKVIKRSKTSDNESDKFAEQS